MEADLTANVDFNYMNFGLGKSSSAFLLLVALLFPTMIAMPAVSAQTQYIGATPNYINLGMTTSIAVTAPAAGSYTVVIQKPAGTQTTLNYTFASAGQIQTSVFGNATTGFKTLVDQVGTYNVFLEQGNALVASNSFQATNKIVISFDMIIAGMCVFVAGGTRGQEMLAQFHVTYASNGATVENFNSTSAKYFAAKVTYTLPSGAVATAKLHANSSTTWPTPWYQGHVWPIWNDSWVGNYYPSVNASDQYGNVGTFKYSGYPFPITPATLSTTIQLSDAKTGQLVGGLYNGQVANITANILYQQVVDPVSGFNGPLDTAVRGGVVTAVVGWGPYNATSGTFGNSKAPGGLIATVPMAYSITSKVWTGLLNVGTLPKLVNASSYEVIVSSHDRASPPNTGFATLNLPAATVQVTTSTATSVSTATGAATAITTTTATSISTTFFVAVSTSLQTVSTVPLLAYATMVVLLIVGLSFGYLVTRKSASQGK